ncbi:MAG: bifunctional demethylmenaquinone methyltransferase/2-methoxy-6-polyprenyl-1,4-benzoquinol methylase UbiE, partial [Novosphingobium sp.]
MSSETSGQIAPETGPETGSETVSFGYEDVAAEDKQGRVGAVFSSVARKYDVMND